MEPGMLDAHTTHISLMLEGKSSHLQVLGFVGREALNQLFYFDSELVNARPDLKLEELLHEGRREFYQGGRGGSAGNGAGVKALVPGVPLIADQARAGSVSDNKAVTSYYGKVQFVTSSGDPVEGLTAAFVLPNKAAPVIFVSDADGYSPQIKADSVQTADVYLVWDDFGVPDGADDYERSRKK
jgi:hypothetical protein